MNPGADHSTTNNPTNGNGSHLNGHSPVVGHTNGANHNGHSHNGHHAEPIPVPVEPSAAATRSPLFEKCEKFTKAEELRQVGLYPYFRRIDSPQDTEVTIDGRRMLMLGSNSYMGLTNDPRIKEAAIKATEKYGTGCAGSRFLNGTLDIHTALEDKFAHYLDKEAALVFTTGFQVNLGVISALVGRGDEVFIDRTDHASIVDGARLGFGKIKRFEHNDVDDLDRLLENSDARGRLIVVDGIYSMEGDIAKLPRVVEVARKHGAGIFVDDAHSIGVLGSRGNGTADHFGLTNEVDIIAGTFSKSLASIGGYVAADRDVIDYLKHHARALIFSASMAPGCVAAASKALDIIIEEPWRREALWRNTHFMLNNLKEMGFDTGDSETPIIPLVAGELEQCFTMWRHLHDEGIFINPVVPPATPENRCLIRLSVMATHTEAQLSYALEVIDRVARKVGVGRVAH